MERRPPRPTAKGSADWFRGDVYVDPIAHGGSTPPVTLGCVHFTPGAHTAWHRHRGGQTLYCTEGEGFVQARGGPLIRLRPGDIVVTEPDEWHWHGATAERFMVHFAFTVGDTEWAEHLTDAEYPPPTDAEDGGPVARG
jgi:quercetin dioxygenase-like cupin family protein